MGMIRLLDRATADLIAAGEVVERPASVVKELVENCIDAGANDITVEISDGGISSIRVTDNGCGMSKEDARQAFLRHATSKISSGDDLFRLHTLGFRGEALAAICAVSKIDLITRRAEDEEGVHLHLEAGEILDESLIGCPVGTTIVVDSLFYNTPARMKFLKKNTTEGTHVAATMDKLAMVAPNVAFRFLREGKQELLTTGNGDLYAAIYAVYGKTLADGLLPLSSEGRGIKVSGFIGRPDTGKPTRNFQNFFVNGRAIRSRMLSAAVDDGKKSYFERDRHPLCILMLEVDCSLVDVNVHPTKQEVKFSNEREIYSAVYFAVKNAYSRVEELTKADLLSDIPLPFEVSDPGEQVRLGQGEGQPSEKKEPLMETIFASLPQEQYIPVGRSYVRPPSADISVDGDLKDDIPVWMPQPFGVSEPSGSERAPLNMEIPKGQDEEDVPIILVGELFHTYIVAQRGDEVIFMDKHAAQERLVYETIKGQKDCQDITQELLSPVAVSLSKQEAAELFEHEEFLVSLGFNLSSFGNDTVLVRGIPLNLCDADIPSMISEVASLLQEGRKDLKSQLYDRVMYSIACKASIKGGQKNGREELLYLLEKVLEMPDVRYCPHGRPVAVFLSKKAFEKQFGR